MRISTGEAVVGCLIVIALSFVGYVVRPDFWAEEMVFGMFATILAAVLLWGEATKDPYKK